MTTVEACFSVFCVAVLCLALRKFWKDSVISTKESDECPDCGGELPCNVIPCQLNEMPGSKELIPFLEWISTPEGETITRRACHVNYDKIDGLTVSILSGMAYVEKIRRRLETELIFYKVKSEQVPIWCRDVIALHTTGLKFKGRKKVVTFDLDGTAFDISHRTHHIAKFCGKCGGEGEVWQRGPAADELVECDFCHGKGKTTKRYDKFFKECHLDTPVPVIVEWMKALSETHYIVIITGRDMAKCGDATVKCLANNNIPYDYLLMKAPDDSRTDDVIKREMINGILKTLPKHRFDFAVEDRGQVIRMIKSMGLKVYPVRCNDVDFE